MKDYLESKCVYPTQCLRSDFQMNRGTFDSKNNYYIKFSENSVENEEINERNRQIIDRRNYY